VVAIIAILASIAVVNFGKVQSRSRDARRKADVRTYEAAIEKFRLTDSTIPDAGIKDASGNSLFYGRMNFTASQGGGQYASTSIASALLSRGLITSIVRDPSGSSNDTLTDKLDYVLIRCNAAGGQIITNATETSFAVWAKLENPATGNDAENTGTYCGSRAGTKFGYNNTANSPYPKSTDPQPVDTAKFFSYGNKKL
jgi:type II secretory pathway pseudopilin PulG